MDSSAMTYAQAGREQSRLWAGIGTRIARHPAALLAANFPAGASDPLILLAPPRQGVADVVPGASGTGYDSSSHRVPRSTASALQPEPAGGPHAARAP